MKNRFEDASEKARVMLETIRAQHFKELNDAKILLLFDLKRRATADKITFAQIKKSDDLIRHISADDRDMVYGFDYIITVDKLLWDNIENTDRERVLRHELRHSKYDPESETIYKIRPHTIEDFHEEVELNHDDPQWGQKLAVSLEALYDQQKNPQMRLPMG